MKLCKLADRTQQYHLFTYHFAVDVTAHYCEVNEF